MNAPLDAIVIGTGFGGAVAACRLSQAGFKPLVLERGRRYERSDFPALPNPSRLLPDFGRWTWGHDQGLWDIEDLEEIVAVQAAGYGGGSLVYANVHLRPPREVFDDRWPREYRNGAGLEDYFNLAAWMLDVKPIRDDHHDYLADGVPAKAIRLRQVADGLVEGRSGGKCESTFFYPPLAVNYERPKIDGKNQFGVEQGPCVSCGACCTGCPHGAKNTLDLNYLALAENRGAVVKTECEVVGIARGGDDLWVVDYIDHLQAEKVQVRTKYLFLCAGSVHSTRLLAKWQASLPAGKQDPQLRANLGLGYFSNADALGMVYDARDEAFPSWGPAITTSTVHGQTPSDAPSRPWFMLQDGGYAPALDRLLGTLRGAVWMGRNRYKGSPRSGRPHPPRLPVGEPPKVSGPAPRRDGNLPSPVDQVLDALGAGLWKKILPGQIAGRLEEFRRDLAHPMLRPVVERTVELAVTRVAERSVLIGWFRGTPVFRWIVAAFRWLALFCLGGAERVAEDALQAILDGGGLSREELASRVGGYSGEGRDRRLMLLAMGRDQAPGRLHYDCADDRLYADMDLFHHAPLYAHQERSMRDVARELGGELRVNPAWAFLGKPITVHSQGGCRMGDQGSGVTAENGEVWGHPGLYVLDGAILCTSVGVNPSATIAALAERNIDAFLTTHCAGSWPTTEYMAQRVRANDRYAANKDRWAFTPPALPDDTCAMPDSKPIGLAFTETMTGFCSDVNQGSPSYNDEKYRYYENKGRPDHSIQFKLTASVRNLQAFFEDKGHKLDLRGHVTMRLRETDAKEEKCRVEGTLQLMVPGEVTSVLEPPGGRHKQYGLDRSDPAEKAAIATQTRIAGVAYSTIVSPRPRSQLVGDVPRRSPAKGPAAPVPEERFMFYDLSFTDGGKHPWKVLGYKRLRDTPDVHAWRDTTWLFMQVIGPETHRAGVAHVDLPGFIKQMESLTVFASDAPPDFTEPNPDDPALADSAVDDPERVAWMVSAFIGFFFGNLQRVYVPNLSAMLGTFFRLPGRKGP